MREIINVKRKVDQQLVVANSEQNRTHTQLMLLQVILLSKQQLIIKEKRQELGLMRAASWFRQKINGVKTQTNGYI